MDIETRKKNLEKIKISLQDAFEDQLLSAIVYGSTLNEDFCIKSDYDLLLIFKRTNFTIFKKLRKIKADFLSEGIPIDFNIQLASELPAVRKEMFWHNNRGLYVQKELAMYGHVLIGKNFFKECLVDNDLMLGEAVKVINSLNYQMRKLLINGDISKNENKILIIKWCIYGSLYALAARGIYPEDRRAALETFHAEFKPKINPTKFLHMKVQRPDNITQKDIKVAHTFLGYLDRLIFNEYSKKMQRE